MLDRLLAAMAPVLSSTSAEAASLAFDAVARPLGATYLQTRLYRRPQRELTPDTHWQAGGFVVRLAPTAWPGSDAFRYVCLECNPLVAAIRQGRTTYRFSDYAPQADASYGPYWEALGEAGIGDALCATAYGPDRAIASLHLGVPAGWRDEHGERSLRFAGLLLSEHLLTFSAADGSEPVALTPRERDALLYVASGKTDWEIGRILGVAEATARFHVDNARRKLGAVNRAHAVARFLANGGIH